MTWLVTGGAGYIGAHVVHALLDAGEDVVILDNLSTGIAERVATVPTVHGSVLDPEVVRGVLREYAVTGVVHIAAKKQPGDSVERPLYYYRENVDGLVGLLEAMGEEGVDTLVFSSSAAVYGTHEDVVLTEEADCRPDSPYGETKLVGEWIIADLAAAQNLRYVNLRYFNVVGAARPELADIGAFNLVPMIFERLTAGKPPQVFGDDYPTPDGTCIRDYIHVSDIAAAHVAAARHLAAGREAGLTLNVGTGRGSSVREIVDNVLDVSGFTGLEPVVVDRRPGDPPASIASAERIREVFGWTARHDVRAMIESAWAGWVHHHPELRRGG